MTIIDNFLSKIRLRFKCETYKSSDVITILIRNGEAVAFGVVEILPSSLNDNEFLLIDKARLKVGLWHQEHLGVKEDAFEAPNKDTKLKEIPLLWFIRFRDGDYWCKLDGRDEYKRDDFKGF